MSERVESEITKSGMNLPFQETRTMDRKLEKKKWPPKRIVKFSIVGILGFTMAYGFLFRDSHSKLNINTERISISTVWNGPFQEFIPVHGTVLPIKTIYLDAIEGGRVEKVFVEAGTLVHQGDPILKMTNTNLQLDVMHREAQLFEQINNLRNTRLAMEQNRLKLQADLTELDYKIQRQKRYYDRNKELVEKEVISKQEYDEVKDEYEYFLNRRELTFETQRQDSLLRKIQLEQLEAAVKRMQSNLEMVKQNVENLVIKAPISGHLTSLNAEIGQSKSPRERLGHIDVLEGFKIGVAIDEYYITRIDVGQTGEFNFSGKTYRLTVKKIYPEVRDGRFDVDMEFDGEEPEGIRRGQTFQIRLELGDLSEAVLLARGGFYQETGGRWGYVLNEAGTSAFKRQIRLGRQNPHVFEVLEGLEPGEKVITSNYEGFGDMDELILKKKM